MKKNITIIIFCSLSILSYTQGIYDIDLKNSSGNSIQLNSTTTKPIFIWIVDAEHATGKMLQTVDSIASNFNTRIRMIMLPVIPKKGDTTLQYLKAKASQMNFELVLEPIIIKSNNKPDKDPVLDWIWDKGKNKHFDIKDFTVFNQYLLVAKNGTLIGFIADANRLPSSAVPKIINGFVKQ